MEMKNRIRQRHYELCCELERQIYETDAPPEDRISACAAYRVEDTFSGHAREVPLEVMDEYGISCESIREMDDEEIMDTLVLMFYMGGLYD